jgi:two-component system NtrC family sensor kinase
MKIAKSKTRKPRKTPKLPERSQILEELEYREQRYRSIAESTPDGMVTVNADGSIVLWNRAAEKIFGYSVKEMLGKPLNRIMPKRFHEAHKSRLDHVASGGKPRIIGKTVELIGLRKDKSEFPLELSMAKWKTGEGVFFTAVIRDITERKQTEETLQQSQERYQNLVENINDIIFEVDTEGNMTYISPAIERFAKYKADEFIGQNFSRFVHPDDMPGLISSFLRVLAGILKPFEFRVLDKDGSIHYARSNSRQRMQHGQVIGITGVLSDITEQKKMLDSLTITDRLAALGNMAGGFAHELNNPLTGVIGYVQLLLDREDLSEDVRKDLTGIYKEAQRASEVIKNFMVFALKQPQQKQPSDINDLINDVLKLRQHEQRNNNIKVKTNLDPQLPLVMVGPTRIRQVFLDIIINAEYFMFEAHKKGTLTISTETEGDIIRASFADDGPGIPPKNLGQIFNPFFTTKEVGQGVGLGLSICHSIVTEHGGNIYVESEPGKGATFIVELPISKE